VTATIAHAGEAPNEYELIKRDRTLHIYTGNAGDKAARQALIQWTVVNDAVTEFPTYRGLAVFAVIFGALAAWGYLATGTFPPPPAGVSVTGITLTPFAPETGQLTLDPPPTGLRVVRVEKSSNWHDAGVLTDDVLVEVGQQPVDTVKEVARLIQVSQRQGGVPITVWREGSLLDLWLPLD
jgi:S1-C subfamily serine protease